MNNDLFLIVIIRRFGKFLSFFDRQIKLSFVYVSDTGATRVCLIFQCVEERAAEPYPTDGRMFKFLSLCVYT